MVASFFDQQMTQALLLFESMIPIRLRPFG